MADLAVIKFWPGEEIRGRPLLFVGILCLVASIQFLTTGVLAEMLTRTFYASTHRTDHAIAWQSDPTTAGWRGER
jgi:hypothetical protein